MVKLARLNLSRFVWKILNEMGLKKINYETKIRKTESRKPG
jgi:hypothetical protein